MEYNTFNNKALYYLGNVYSNKNRIKDRPTSERTKGGTCKGSIEGTRGKRASNIQKRSCFSKELRRSKAFSTKVYLKGKQCKSSIVKVCKGIRDLFLTHIFYNPSFWTLCYIIDMNFSDDFINQSIMRHEYVFTMTQCLLYGMCNTN